MKGVTLDGVLRHPEPDRPLVVADHLDVVVRVVGVVRQDLDGVDHGLGGP